MSSTNYEIPWSEGKIRTLDIVCNVEQGQLLNISGCLADASKGIKAHYIACASISGGLCGCKDSRLGGRIGVFQNSVVSNMVIASGRAGDDVYLGDDGGYTLDRPLSGIVQIVGVVRPDRRAQINLECTHVQKAIQG